MAAARWRWAKSSHVASRPAHGLRSAEPKCGHVGDAGQPEDLRRATSPPAARRGRSAIPVRALEFRPPRSLKRPCALYLPSIRPRRSRPSSAHVRQVLVRLSLVSVSYVLSPVPSRPCLGSRPSARSGKSAWHTVRVLVLCVNSSGLNRTLIFGGTVRWRQGWTGDVPVTGGRVAAKNGDGRRARTRCWRSGERNRAGQVRTSGTHNKRYCGRLPRLNSRALPDA